MKRMFNAILVISTILIVILILGKINLSTKFSRQVAALFSQSNNISAKKFTYSQLTGLPEPVQRYFKHVLKEGQPYISFVSLTHKGQFKTGQDKRWANITGEQYFTTEKPGYIWKGKMAMATARDMYIADKGRLIVTVLGFINVVDGQGQTFNEGELQRWLAESVWFPTNLLPSERLQWSAIDAKTAKLIFNYKELSISFLVTFKASGEISQIETKRFMDKDHKEIWIGKMNDYKNMHGILIPTSIEAIWRLDKGDFSYAKFDITKLEYKKPEM